MDPQKELHNYKEAFPVCSEHVPDGGHRSSCLVCDLQKYSNIISRIDYVIGEPNEMEISMFDLDYIPEAVLDRVSALVGERVQNPSFHLCKNNEMVNKEAASCRTCKGKGKNFDPIKMLNMALDDVVVLVDFCRARLEIEKNDTPENQQRYQNARQQVYLSNVLNRVGKPKSGD